MSAQLHLGDCLEVLRTMPDASVNCCVTSPPYWGLRDYGHDGQIGLEATPEEYVDRLVGVFREVRRVLRDDGTLWLNLGDSYNAYNANRGTSTSISDGAAGDHPKHRQGLSTPLLKNKDLVGILWRVAFALQADGWYLRQDIIWHKPNPMPESVTDRCTKAHEYVFLLSKSARYHYDSEAIKEPAVSTEPAGNGFAGRQGGERGAPMSGGRGSTEPWAPKGKGGKSAFRGQGHFRDSEGGPANRNGRQMKDVGVADTRNRRSVWTVATKPFYGAHFAVMPPDLARLCILAGCPKGGVVYDPFTGSGTVAEQALLLGRDFEGSEINPDYHAISKQRISRAQAAGHQPDLFSLSPTPAPPAPQPPTGDADPPAAG
jgi:DNA modification methylase